MKYLAFSLKNRWHRFLGGLAVLVVFFIPTTRIVLGQIVRLSAPNKIAPQSPDNARNRNYNPRNNNHHNHNNHSSCNVSSNSAPNSRSTASPMRTDSSSSSGHSSRGNHHRSINRPEPK